jgi:Imidazolonepropionase and related amidohydrolases
MQPFTALPRSFSGAVLATFAFLLSACSPQEPPAQTQATPTVPADVTEPAPVVSDAVVYEGARLIIGDGSPPIENGLFIVENGRFTVVGEAAAVTLPAGARRVDLSGKTVMPTIIDTHVHLSTEREALIEDLRKRATYGVSAALSMGMDNTPDVFAVREERAPGIALYFTAGRGITSPEPGRTEAPHWVTTEEEARAAVREEAARGVDIIKIWVDDRNGQYDKLPAELYRAVIEEAHAAGLRVAAHIFALEDAKELLRAGIDVFAHGVRDQDIDEEFINMMRDRSHVVLIPNLPARGIATDLEWLRGTIPDAQLQQLLDAPTGQENVITAFGIQARNLQRLSQAGVRITVGTDGNTPWGPHIEMEDMVAAGMSPMNVLTAATRNGAEFLGLNDRGTLAAGKVADFIVLDANPLDAITNTRRINSVYLAGEEVQR